MAQAAAQRQLTPAAHQRLNRWVLRANNVGESFTYPFTIEGRRVGRLIEPHYYALAALADLFQVGDGLVSFPRAAKTAEARSALFEQAIARLLASGALAPRQIRQEVFGAMDQWGERPLFWGERAGFTFFGLKSFGIHVHGLAADGTVWLGERAAHKNTDPGKLDQLAAGGQPLGLSLQENLVKECWEEAGIPAELAASAELTSIVPIRAASALGYHHLDLFLYDLALPEGFEPQNQDGEVARFHRFTPSELAERLLDDAEAGARFPADVAVCLLELLARQGLVDEQQFSHPIRRPAGRP